MFSGGRSYCLNQTPRAQPTVRRPWARPPQAADRESTSSFPCFKTCLTLLVATSGRCAAPKQAHSLSLLFVRGTRFFSTAEPFCPCDVWGCANVKVEATALNSCPRAKQKSQGWWNSLALSAVVKKRERKQKGSEAHACKSRLTCRNASEHRALDPRCGHLESSSARRRLHRQAAQGDLMTRSEVCGMDKVRNVRN